MQVLVLSSGGGRHESAVLRNLSPVYDVRVTSSVQEFMEGVGRARAAVVLTRGLVGMAGLASRADLGIPLVLVRPHLPDGGVPRQHGTGGECIQDLVSERGIDALLLQRVTLRIIEAHVDWIRASILSNVDPVRHPRLREGLAAALSLDGPPVRSVKAMSVQAGCSPRHLEKRWRNTREGIVPAVRLKDVLTGALVQRMIRSRIAEPGASWAGTAHHLGVSPRTLERLVRRWSGLSPGEFTIARAPRMLERVESEVVGRPKVL